MFKTFHMSRLHTTRPIATLMTNNLDSTLSAALVEVLVEVDAGLLAPVGGAVTLPPLLPLILVGDVVLFITLEDRLAGKYVLVRVPSTTVVRGAGPSVSTPHAGFENVAVQVVELGPVNGPIRVDPMDW